MMILLRMRFWTYSAITVIIFTATVTKACIRGGRLSIRRPKNEPPLVYHEHVPNALELSPDASGKAEIRIWKKSPRFKRLAFNSNPDIIFKDEELRVMRKGMVPYEDHYMTQRCKEKLDYLSILVKNTWPGIKVRVVEAWDQQGIHTKDSLHYEGRAIDITTSDRKRMKLGLLARRAVQAGFDYVYYESRNHVHVSCKSDYSSSHKRALKCFTGTGVVTTPYGPRQISELRSNDDVLTVNPDGEMVYSPIIGFLDRAPHLETEFIEITIQKTPFQTTANFSDSSPNPENSEELTSVKLTEFHLIYKLNRNISSLEDLKWYDAVTPVFANELRVGDTLLQRSASGKLIFGIIRNLTETLALGAYAPLTLQGNIIVDDTVASCYAITKYERLAHAAMSILRGYHHLRTLIPSINSFLPPDNAHTEGIHIWAGLLLRMTHWLSPIIGKITV